MHLRNNSKIYFIQRRVVILLAFFLFSGLLIAQRGEINQSFFNNNLGLYNPSLIGGIRKMNVNVFSKFGNLETSQKNYLNGLNFEYSFNRKHNLGLGATNLRESDWMNTQIFIGYAYKHDFKDKPWSLGVGANIGFKNISHFNYLIPLAPLDTSIYSHKNPNQYQVYASIGLVLWWKDRVYFSLSGENIIPYNNYKFDNNDYDKEKGLNNSPSASIAIGTRNAEFGDSIIKKSTIEANLMAAFYFTGIVKYKVEINFGVNIMNLVTPRIGFRFFNDYFITLGLQGRVYKGLFLSYGYDVTINTKTSNIEGKGSHEFGLGYFIPHQVREFQKTKKKK
ncbi:MAG: type IX secretion system membrane protein PorP/SprF [Crocinitomicaceae bacterium]